MIKILLKKYIVLFLTLSLLTGNLLAYSSQSSWHAFYHPNTPRQTWSMLAEQLRSRSYFSEPGVKRVKRWYLRNPGYLKLLSHNAKPYLYYVFQQTQQRHLPALIALLPMIESNYNPFLYSAQGATGLWQIMPGTATGLGLKINWWYDGRRDTVASTRAALDYLQYLHRFFNNWLLAIAAYNSGEGTIQNAIRYNRRHNRPTDYWHLALPAETKAYIPKLLALASIVADNSSRDHLLAPIPYRPYFSTVTLKGQYDLNYLAKHSGISTKELRQLNPGFRRSATGPMSKHTLIIPYGKKALFDKHTDSRHQHHISWQHHRVVKGDNLITLAHRYHTTPAIIKRVNKLHSDLLQLKQSLLIPRTRNKTLRSMAHQAPNISEDRLPGPRHVIHTVKRFETLWSIARHYHLKPREIRFWNNLSMNTRLHPHQSLVLWQPHAHHASHYFLHKIKRNDNLITLARRFSTSVHSIKLYNNLHTDRIRVNQVLKIPYPVAKHYKETYRNQMVAHHVQPGDSISKLAHYYRVSKSDLVKWNHLDPHRFLKLGQTLIIYLHRSGKS